MDTQPVKKRVRRKADELNGFLAHKEAILRLGQAAESRGLAGKLTYRDMLRLILLERACLEADQPKADKTRDEGADEGYRAESAQLRAVKFAEPLKVAAQTVYNWFDADRDLAQWLLWMQEVVESSEPRGHLRDARRLNQEQIDWLALNWEPARMVCTPPVSNRKIFFKLKEKARASTSYHVRRLAEISINKLYRYVDTIRTRRNALTLVVPGAKPKGPDHYFDRIADKVAMHQKWEQVKQAPKSVDGAEPEQENLGLSLEF